MSIDRPLADQAAIRTQFGAVFVSLELSRSKWLVTSLSPGEGEKLSKRAIVAGDAAALLDLFADLRRKAAARSGRTCPLVCIQEAGLDGFSLHRILEREGIESHIVDASSIAVPRRRRRAKTDKIDGEALLRNLLAWKRGEPRVCAMVRPPSPQEEDERRITRERQTLVGERTTHINRIKGLLFAQGVSGYEPARKDRRARLEALATADGRPLPPHLKQAIARELDRLELVLDQIAEVEAARERLLADKAAEQGETSPSVMLSALRGIASGAAAVLWTEGFSRSFCNRRQIAAYAGLAPTPWASGSIAREQGVSKAGNPRLRTIMIQISWLWLRHQPTSTLALWYRRRVSERSAARKITIVALARKLLVALWKYVTAGEAIEGAVMKA